MTKGENANRNPYAAPRVAARVDELPARVTMRMRWLFIVMFTISGLYQIVACVWVTWARYSAGAMAGNGRMMDWLLIPCFFTIAGFVALYVVWCLLRGRWSREVFWMGLVVAFLTWAPFLILNAVPVSLWIFKRPGRGGDGKGHLLAKKRVAIPDDEAIRILKTEAMIRFGIREDQFGVSLARGLRFAPGEVDGFLEDLEVDHGISLRDEVDASRVSVQEMLEVVARRAEGV